MTASGINLARADRVAAAAARPAPELSVIVPAFNERANIPILVERLSRALAACDWEVIFVDDNSPDGTAAAAASPGPVSKVCWRARPTMSR
jgi:dolichol-phosphate mannosyltransferase